MIKLIFGYCSHCVVFDVLGTGTMILVRKSLGYYSDSHILLIVLVIILKLSGPQH